MIRNHVILACALVLSLFSLTAHADWEQRNNGLTSLFIIGVSINPDDPGTIYAQTRFDGIWKSTDGGDSWSSATSGFAAWGPAFGNLVNEGVLIDASDSETLFAIGSPVNSNFGRVYKSTDGGGSWSQSSSGLAIGGLYGIAGLAQDPSDPLHLYAGTIVTGFDGGLFETVDGGATWTNIAGSVITTDGDLGNDCWPVRIDPLDTQTMYCGTPHDALMVSRDAGQTWTEANPSGTGTDNSCYAVALNPANSGELWFDHSSGIYHSTSFATTWTDVSTTFNSDRLTDMKFSPSNPDIAYAIAGRALYRTANNGDTWSLVSAETYFGRSLTVHPTDPDTLYIGTWGRGVLKSTDGGVTLNPANNGLPVTSSIDIDYVAAHPTEAGKAWCHLRGNGLYETSDYGQNWSFRDPLFDNFIDGLVILPWNPDVMLATWYNVYRSTDAGATWAKGLSATGDIRFKGLALDEPQKRIWLLDSGYDSTSPRVLHSANDGQGWTSHPAPGDPPYDQLNDIAVDPFDPNIILVAASPKWSTWMHKGWIHRSTDGGATWTRILEGLEIPGWYIAKGQYSIKSNVLYQDNLNDCDVRLVPRDVIAHDATYTFRTRITNVRDGNTQHWSAISVCLPTLDSPWNDGILAGLRRNGEAFLWADGTVYVSVLDAVSNASQWQTVGVRVQGNTYTLLINGAELGSWTDPTSSWGTGYCCLSTCRAQAQYDNFSVEGTVNYSDNFNIGNWGTGSGMSQVLFSPVEPGVAYARAGGSGIFKSDDHGATWRRITTSSDENLNFYDMHISHFSSGNLYFGKGTFYPPKFEVCVFPNGSETYESVGTSTDVYYRSPIAEDAANPNRLYSGEFGTGVILFTGNVPGDLGISPSQWLVR